MANDYIPRPDDQFHAWQNNFVTYVNGHLADLGLAAGDVVAGWPRIFDPGGTITRGNDSSGLMR